MLHDRDINAEKVSSEGLILEKATIIFLSKGYSRTSADEIARACGVSKKTIYKLYGSKHSLLERVVDTVLAKTEAVIDALMANSSLSLVD